MQHKSAVTCARDTAGLLDTLVLELIAEQRVHRQRESAAGRLLESVLQTI